MIRAFKLLTVAALLTAGALRSEAQTTNLVQTMTLTLTAFTEGTPATNGAVVNVPIQKVKGNTRNIITALGNATSNTFSTKAKLVLITPLAGGGSSIFVRDGTTVVDVSSFISHEQSDDAVEGGQFNTNNGVFKTTAYRMHRFVLEDTGGLDLDFDLRGMATEKSSSIQAHGSIIGESRTLSANLSGEVHIDGKLAIVQGVLTIGPASVEITP